MADKVDKHFVVIETAKLFSKRPITTLVGVAHSAEGANEIFNGKIEEVKQASNRYNMEVVFDVEDYYEATNNEKGYSLTLAIYPSLALDKGINILQ